MAGLVKVTFVLLIFLVFHSTISAQTSNTHSAKTLYHSTFLDANGNFHLAWGFDDDNIIFKVQVKTLGFFGLGISPNGGMKDSDIAVGGVRLGKLYLQDQYATGHSEPKLDDHQDWNLSSGSENDTHTTVTFWRKLNTCDDEDRQIKSETVRVIWAYHSEDWEDAGSRYHGSQRGAKSIFLLNPLKAVPNIPEDSFTIEFLNTNHNVPSSVTTYWCQAFTIKPLLRKHHVIKFEPIIQPGNEGVIHHIVLRACSVRATNATAGQAEACSDRGIPKAWKGCHKTVYVWAVGAGPFYFPDHVGYPFGLDDDPTLFVMQTHYNNPLKRSDIFDASGFRMTLTQILRKHDAGILSTGSLTGSLIVPPLTETFQVTGHCEAECLEETMGNVTEINIFAAFLHSHILGRAIKLRHIRNGVELKPISADDNFDFNFQETRVVEPEATVRKGDNLITECTYSSTERSVPTFGGPSTREEMCLTYVFYYPRIPLSRCYSSVRKEEWAKLVNEVYPGWINNTVSRPKEHREKELYRMLESEIDWRNKLVREHAQKIATSYDVPLRLMCVKDPFKIFKTYGKMYRPRPIKTEWYEPETCTVLAGDSFTVPNR